MCRTGTSNATCCPAATPNCCGNSTCVNLQTDVQNCGACGKQCTTTVAHAKPVCANATCGFTCEAGYKASNGACIATNACSTAADCPVTNPCSGERICLNGTCGCPSGQTLCHGMCVDTASDVNNCGGCGQSCGPPITNGLGTCTGGQCCMNGECGPAQFQCGDSADCCGNQCAHSTEGFGRSFCCAAGQYVCKGITAVSCCSPTSDSGKWCIDGGCSGPNPACAGACGANACCGSVGSAFCCAPGQHCCGIGSPTCCNPNQDCDGNGRCIDRT